MRIQQEKETIEIQEDFQIPGTEIILEKGDRIEVLQEVSNDLEQRANYLMIQAAEDAGIDNPDPELLHWDGKGNLMYYDTTLYPDSNIQKQAYQAWKKYQGYTW